MIVFLTVSLATARPRAASEDERYHLPSSPRIPRSHEVCAAIRGGKRQVSVVGFIMAVETTLQSWINLSHFSLILKKYHVQKDMEKYSVTMYNYVDLLGCMVACCIFHRKKKISVALSQPAHGGGKLFIHHILSPCYLLWKATLILSGRVHIS